MADVYEQNLASKSTLTTTDYIRVVGSDNVSYKQLVSDVAKKIIENYTGSTLAGSAQSVKSAVDSLNSKTTQALTSSIASSGSGLATKVGNAVTVQGSFSGITTSGKGWYDICTLPSGYAPSLQVDATGADNSASSSSDTAVHIRITNAGAVRFYAQSVKTTYAPNFCITYVI